jgi:hypothetical protein
VKKLGASQVFDYKSPTVQEDLINAFKSKTLAGVMDCIGAPAWAICVEVASVRLYIPLAGRAAKKFNRLTLKDFFFSTEELRQQVRGDGKAWIPCPAGRSKAGGRVRINRQG